VPERMTQGEVVDHGLLQRAHRGVPGHGAATCRNAIWSTLA
jgi:hypothetical protein